MKVPPTSDTAGLLAPQRPHWSLHFPSREVGVRWQQLLVYRPEASCRSPSKGFVVTYMPLAQISHYTQPQSQSPQAYLTSLHPRFFTLVTGFPPNFANTTALIPKHSSNAILIYAQSAHIPKDFIFHRLSADFMAKFPAFDEAWIAPRRRGTFCRRNRRLALLGLCCNGCRIGQGVKEGIGG